MTQPIEQSYILTEEEREKINKIINIYGINCQTQKKEVDYDYINSLLKDRYEKGKEEGYSDGYLAGDNNAREEIDDEFNCCSESWH